MKPALRRKEIIHILSASDHAISGSELAAMLDVSRQVIVQDIALLRAEGNEILATPQGYLLLYHDKPETIKMIIASKHNKEQIKDELITIVDEGGTVLDVIVEHSIYGQISGSIMVSSRRDVEKFIDKINKDDTKPLSNLTDGVHLHTISCKDQDTVERIKKNLSKKGYLLS